MDIVIWTSDPETIDVSEIREALEAKGYFVNEIDVKWRSL